MTPESPRGIDKAGGECGYWNGIIMCNGRWKGLGLREAI